MSVPGPGWQGHCLSPQRCGGAFSPCPSLSALQVRPVCGAHDLALPRGQLPSPENPEQQGPSGLSLRLGRVVRALASAGWVSFPPTLSSFWVSVQ